MSNFNVQNEKWLEIAFEDRNKAYGAYQLRKESDATTIKAMLITFGALAAGIGLFSFTTPDAEPIIKDEPKLPPIVTIVELTPIKPVEEPKPVIKKGTDNPRQNLTPNNVAPTVVDKPTVKPAEQPKNPDNSTPYNPNGTENGNPGPTGDPKGTDTKPTTPTTGTGTKPDDSPYKGVLGVEANFPGGIDKFRSFIAENYKIPTSFNKDVLDIVLVFVIEKDGSMTDIRMISKGDKALENEAIRVLKSMKKKWTPGKVNGEIVRSEKRLPLRILLTEIEE